MVNPLVRLPSAGAQTALDEFDRARRRGGRILDALGAAPQTTPCRVVEPATGVRLRAYSPDSATGPVVLLVPAPIKRWYMGDLRRSTLRA